MSGITDIRNKSLLQARIRWYNPRLFRKSIRFFEICDLKHTPKVITAGCQAILAAEWTTKLPLLQRQSPAALAANIISSTISQLEANNGHTTSPVSIVDFCSGAGGPTPAIEQIVNANRQQEDKPSIDFLVTDLKPHLEAWKAAAAKSPHLKYIPESVDATNPPSSLTSLSSDKRIIRTFHLAFHHFPDDLAAQVLKSTLTTADAFVIIELQDRRLFSFILMFLHGLLVWLTGLFWFWKSPLQLVLTYLVPVMPFVMAFDGAVSGARTRELREVLGLIGEKSDGEEDGRVVIRVDGGWWDFECGRVLHTWPFGHMNWIVGRKTFEEKAQENEELS